MKLTLPELALVLLIGPSGSGKSTFARKHFRSTEILSSDFFRALVSDDETNQAASGDAFELLHLVASKRLANGRFTVIDATNIQLDARRPLMRLAYRFHVFPVAIIFDLPEDICQARNQVRPDRQVPPRVVRSHVEQLHRFLDRLPNEGFHTIFRLQTPQEADAVMVLREPLSVNRKWDSGPFDIIGDVHGCGNELRTLLLELGYTVTEIPQPNGHTDYEVTPPPGRKAIFLGDLVDRGPDTPGVLRLAMHMVEAGHALCVSGNHDAKLWKKLIGRDVVISAALAESLKQLEEESPDFVERVRCFLEGLESHYVLDQGRLVVAHAGLKQGLQGRISKRVRDFALYGETTGELDNNGLPVRLNWADNYRGRAKVVYGHTPVTAPNWWHNTICIDTGCVYGGGLTALRYPELDLVTVPSERMHCPPKRPFLEPDSPDE